MENDKLALILLENVNRFMKSAEIIYNTGDYTSSSILFFKCFFAILDLIIYKKLNLTPKDHGERFRILEKEFPDIYENLDKFYPIYRNSYSSILSKFDCDKIREHVKRFIKEQGIF